MNNTIEEATPIIFPHDSLNFYLAHFGMDDFDIDEYITEVNTLYPKTTPFWIQKYEPPLSPPIAPLLESPTILELKSLSDASTTILPVIPNQEVQLISVLKIHKEAVR